MEEHDQIEQLKTKILTDIEKGILQEKNVLPSEYILAEKYGASRSMVKEALKLLEVEKIIIFRPGVGFFPYTKPLFSSGIEQLSSVTSMIEQVEMVPGTILLTHHLLHPTKEDQKIFNCTVEDQMLMVERIRTADGEPVVYCIDKMPLSVLNHQAPPSNQIEESLFEFINQSTGKTVHYAVSEIEPISYDNKISPSLECDLDTSLLLFKQVHYDQQDQPLLYSLNYFKANRFHFHVIRKTHV